MSVKYSCANSLNNSIDELSKEIDRIGDIIHEKKRRISALEGEIEHLEKQISMLQERGLHRGD